MVRHSSDTDVLSVRVLFPVRMYAITPPKQNPGYVSGPVILSLECFNGFMQPQGRVEIPLVSMVIPSVNRYRR
jgi:hypothetical protein